MYRNRDWIQTWTWGMGMDPPGNEPGYNAQTAIDYKEGPKAVTDPDEEK